MSAYPDHRTPEEMATLPRMSHWTFPTVAPERSDEWKRAYANALDYVGNTPAGKAHAAGWADYVAGGRAS
jgi:hypothetical protein